MLKLLRGLGLCSQLLATLVVWYGLQTGAVASEEARHEHEMRVSAMFAAAAADSSKAARLRGMISASRRAPQQPELLLTQTLQQQQQQQQQQCSSGDGDSHAQGGRSRPPPVQETRELQGGSGNEGGHAGCAPSLQKPDQQGRTSRQCPGEVLTVRHAGSQGSGISSSASTTTTTTRRPSQQQLPLDPGEGGVQGCSTEVHGGGAGGSGSAMRRLANARGAVERTLPLLPPTHTSRTYPHAHTDTPILTNLRTQQQDVQGGNEVGRGEGLGRDGSGSSQLGRVPNLASSCGSSSQSEKVQSLAPSSGSARQRVTSVVAGHAATHGLSRVPFAAVEAGIASTRGKRLSSPQGCSDNASATEMQQQLQQQTEQEQQSVPSLSHLSHGGSALQGHQSSSIVSEQQRQRQQQQQQQQHAPQACHVNQEALQGEGSSGARLGLQGPTQPAAACTCFGYCALYVCMSLSER